MEREYHPPQEIWTKPDLYKEAGEIGRTAMTFANGNAELQEKIINCFKQKFPNASLEPLTDEIWKVLENTDSYEKVHLGEIEKATELAESYHRKWKRKLADMEAGKPFEAPIIFEMNGCYHKVAGNTRLMLARALGITPKVVIIHYEEN